MFSNLLHDIILTNPAQASSPTAPHLPARSVIDLIFKSLKSILAYMWSYN